MTNMNQYDKVTRIVPPAVEEEKEFPALELQAALLYAQDILERSTLNDFVLLGETAKTMYENINTQGKGVELGLLKKDLTKSGYSLFRSLVPDLSTRGNSFYFEYRGVPIRLFLMPSDTAYMRNPDRLYFANTEFQIPNPINKYLRGEYDN